MHVSTNPILQNSNKCKIENFHESEWHRSIEHHFRWARHVHMIVFLPPFNLQWSSRKIHRAILCPQQHKKNKKQMNGEDKKKKKKTKALQVTTQSSRVKNYHIENGNSIISMSSIYIQVRHAKTYPPSTTLENGCNHCRTSTSSTGQCCSYN